MSNIDPNDDVNALAAEYVLGTLDEANRIEISARRQNEPVLDQAIADWERRLMPLALSTRSVEPPPGLFERIMRRIDYLNHDAADNIVHLTKRLQRWRRFAIGVSAIAASLLAYIGFQSLRPPQPDQFVAVLQQSNTSPAFLVSVDLKTRELSVRAVAAPAQPGKSYELWIVNDKLGAPRSLGVVDTQGVNARRALARYDSTVVRDAVYAISLEPAGGSPTGQATGPVLYSGKLLQLEM
jgi:anti-sigma-K factor RskA